MIDDATITKLFAELDKVGNIGRACVKVGIGRTTYYRWCKENPSLRKKLREAVRTGRSQMTDIAEHTLFDIGVRDRNVPALLQILKHNSPRYKQKNTTSTVVLKHERGVDVATLLQEEDRVKINEETRLIKKLIEDVRSEHESRELETRTPSEPTLPSPSDLPLESEPDTYQVSNQ